MSCWAVIPLKSAERCKTRLAPALSPAARRRLAAEMFDSVLAAVRGSVADTILVVTPIPLALPRGVLLLQDAEQGLNAALADARRAARAGGATRLAIVAADLPDLRACDVNALLAANAQNVVIAPDRSGTGTNALCVPASSAFGFAYGAVSAKRHAAHARDLGLGVELVTRPALAFDVDTPTDHSLLVASRERLSVPTSRGPLPTRGVEVA